VPCATDGQKCDSAAVNPGVIIKPLAEVDGTHPGTSGQRKVADMLLTFFQTDSTARAWYLAR